MKKQAVLSYRFETSSLSSLKLVLTEARRALPPRLAKKDASDELALQFIQRMKTEYKKQTSTARKAVEPEQASSRGMVKANV